MKWTPESTFHPAGELGSAQSSQTPNAAMVDKNDIDLNGLLAVLPDAKNNTKFILASCTKIILDDSTTSPPKCDIRGDGISGSPGSSTLEIAVIAVIAESLDALDIEDMEAAVTKV